jgi:hypothetical protein
VLREIAGWLAGTRAREGRSGPFDIVADGTTPADEPAAAAETARLHAEAGATWWIEADWSADATALRRRIEAGPPRG